MKKICTLLSVVTCFLLMTILPTGCAKTFNEKEMEQLKENISVYCTEAHENIVSHDEYRDAVLLERVIEYRDIYDNSNATDWCRIYSKYQQPDGSVLYFETPLNDMTGYGEMSDNHFPLVPFSEREEYYNAQRDLATAGKSSHYPSWELEQVGNDAYAMANDTSCVYYFMME